MDVRRVHSRRIAAPPDRVGLLLDNLGSDDDRLWAGHRWPPHRQMRFDRPLGVGAVGGHGHAAYVVEAYEPGRALTFLFADGFPLVGTHRLIVEADGEGGSRLVHILDAEVRGSMLLLWPIVRRAYDSYVEDLFDCAERAVTGSRPEEARQPLWLRTINRVDATLTRRRAPRWLVRLGGIAVPTGLFGAAAIHAAWATGWRWPGGDDRAWADRVIGAGSDVPATPAIWAVAALLALAGGVVAHAARSRRLASQLATGIVAAALLLRGGTFPPQDLLGGLDDHFERLDLVLYSPLCLALGLGAVVVATAPKSEEAPCPKAIDLRISHSSVS